jgi:hypothetical protein
MALRKPVIGIPEGGPHTALGELPTGDMISGADVDLSTALHNTLGGKEGVGPEFVHLSAAELATLAAHLADGTIHFTEGSINHLNIMGIGVNSHAAIDTHIANTANPHAVTAAQAGAEPANANIQAHVAGPVGGNPHGVTFTQAVAADAGTNITAAEAETLTDGSNADALHTHAGGGGLVIDVVQARRSTSFAVPGAWADITLNNTDVETDAAVVEHNNVSTDNIDLKSAGLYRLEYKIDPEMVEQSNDIARLQGRIRIDDTTVIPGSFSQQTLINDASIDNFETLDSQCIGFCYYVSAGSEFATLQAQLVQLGGSGLVVATNNISFIATYLGP